MKKSGKGKTPEEERENKIKSIEDQLVEFNKIYNVLISKRNSFKDGPKRILDHNFESNEKNLISFLYDFIAKSGIVITLNEIISNQWIDKIDILLYNFDSKKLRPENKIAEVKNELQKQLKIIDD